MSDIISLLCCPSCHDKLSLVTVHELKCVSKECSFGTRGRDGFPVLNGQPILIDFSKSIISRDDFNQLSGSSVIPRKKGAVKASLSKVVNGENTASPKNAVDFLKLVKEKNASPIVLVVGGGVKGVGVDLLTKDPKVKLISFDIYLSQTTNFVADAHAIPLPDKTIDGVWVQAVLEHVVQPEKVVAEIHRVLKSGGIVYSETPFMQHVHEGAYDFTRFTESGHRWLFRNFELIKSGPVLGVGTMLIWSIRFFLSSLFRNKNLGIVFSAPFFWVRFFDKLIPEKNSIDAASGFYFLGSASEHEISPRQLINFYARNR